MPIRFLLAYRMVLTFAILYAQTPATIGPGSTPAQFDVASIKPVRGGDIDPANSVTLNLQRTIAEHSHGGVFRVPDANLDLLIQLAYKLKSDQILGEPAWAHSEGYAVTAKVGSDIAFDQMRPMLQALIADRFGLVFRKEVRQQFVYELAPSKAGLKISQSKVGSCTPIVPGQPPAQVGVRFCGAVIYGSVEPGVAQLEGFSVPISSLVEALSDHLGRPVIDKTEYSGKVDFRLTFSSDTTADAGNSQVPTLAVALQEQLGLDMRATKGPVEVLVVDHVVRPTPN
jgi:uncharacterized protein (TIGR03435 family)